VGTPERKPAKMPSHQKSGVKSLGRPQMGGGIMSARLDSVAKYICERGRWRVTNLQLQKIIYMIQMDYLGKTGQRLVEADFEAWDYGPVEPALYRKVRMFGSDPVRDVFMDARRFKEDDERRKEIDFACDRLLKMKPGQLVDISHWDEGAWAKNYVPRVRGIKIPDADIIEEYRKRVKSTA
jgi:uncharacterized phage-associated protein